jgi:hypothetical protein
MHQGHARLRLFFPCLLGLVIAVPAHAAKGYHLWYDENGQAVYSQLPPEDGRPTEIVKPPPPPAEPPEVAQQRLQEQIQKSADFFEDKELAKEKADKASAEAEQAQQRCDAAKKNLEVFEGSPRKLIMGSDGVARRLTEEERQQQREEMEKIIAESCN